MRVPYLLILLLLSGCMLQDPGLQPVKTDFKEPLPSVADATITSEGLLTIPLRNDVGNELKLISVQGSEDCPQPSVISITYKDGKDMGDLIVVGELFFLTIKCPEPTGKHFSTDITLTYNDDFKRVDETQTGAIRLVLEP